MNKIIEIHNLDFSYQDKIIFQNLNLTIEKNKFTAILGANGSGKTTLLKLLIGQEKGNSVIMINKLPLIKENLPKLYKEIGVVLESKEQNFVAETVADELAFTLENLKFSHEQITKAIDKIANLLNIKDLLNKEPSTLNTNDKQLIALASALIVHPKILIIDEGLNELNAPAKTTVLNLLKDLIKKQNLTVVYFTNDSNDTLYSDNVVILSDNRVLISGPKEKIYQDENNFKDAKLKLPFIIDLSKRLRFYELIDHDYIDPEKMVNDLWK